jgi:hypothetical protein
MILSSDGYEICVVDKRHVIVKGIGKDYYQDGFPIAMASTILAKQNFEISVLHIADELLKNGWKPDRVINTLKAELSDTIQGDVKIPFDLESLHTFCFASYEEQRNMIFEYLFNMDAEKAKDWLRKLPIEKTE